MRLPISPPALRDPRAGDRNYNAPPLSGEPGIIRCGRDAPFSGHALVAQKKAPAGPPARRRQAAEGFYSGEAGFTSGAPRRPPTAWFEAAAGAWRYFVTVNLRTGATRFATTYQEFLHDRAIYIQYCQQSSAC